MAIFVGRERELTGLDEVLEDAWSGGGRLVLVSGEPGIGKTRLAEESMRRAATRGFFVAWGRGWEGAGTPAYFPWLQVVRRLRPSFDVLFEASRSACAELSALL